MLDIFHSSIYISHFLYLSLANTICLLLKKGIPRPFFNHLTLSFLRDNLYISLSIIPILYVFCDLHFEVAFRTAEQYRFISTSRNFDIFQSNQYNFIRKMQIDYAYISLKLFSTFLTAQAWKTIYQPLLL